MAQPSRPDEARTPQSSGRKLIIIVVLIALLLIAAAAIFIPLLANSAS